MSDVIVATLLPTDKAHTFEGEAELEIRGMCDIRIVLHPKLPRLFLSSQESGTSVPSDLRREGDAWVPKSRKYDYDITVHLEEDNPRCVVRFKKRRASDATEPGPLELGQLPVSRNLVNKLAIIRAELAFSEPSEITLAEVQTAETKIGAPIPYPVLAILAATGRRPSGLFALQTIVDEQGFGDAEASAKNVIVFDAYPSHSQHLVCYTPRNDRKVTACYSWDLGAGCSVLYYMDREENEGLDDGFEAYLIWRYWKQLDRRGKAVDFSTSPTTEELKDAAPRLVQARSNAPEAPAKGGAKVSHPKFGTGSVISEDGDTLTIQFEVGTKRLKRAFVSPL